MDGARTLFCATALALFCSGLGKPAPTEATAAAAVLVACGNDPVLVVGERHGEPRGHAFFVRVVEALSARRERLLVGLEIPADRGEDLRAALKGAESPSFPVVDGPSYRDLLKSLGRLAGRGVVVEGLDAGVGESDSRDEVMARGVLEALRSAGFDRIVVLVGNIHALKEIPWASRAHDRRAEKLAGRLAAAGVPVTSVVQWFPEGSMAALAPAYREAGSPEADAAVQGLWGLLNTVPSAGGAPEAAADGAVVWAPRSRSGI